MPGVKGEVASLLFAFAQRGIAAPIVRESELWEIACMLGVGLDDTPRPDVPFSQGGRDPNLAARIARGRGEEPEWVEVRSYHPQLT